ncbi:MAG: septal ring factor EnvC (AmiA/AmiB activator) [Yoonia sp.]|jgi:septal ring factor EnvC (AmiA/AmiB activator)
MIRLASLLICLSSAALGQQAAQDAVAKLQQARAQLDAADGSADRIAALTQAVQAYEVGISAMRAGQRELALRETGLTERLAEKREGMGQLLGVLATISRTPQPVLRAHPSGPLNTARAGMLVADITPALAAETAELRALLAQTRTLRQVQYDATQVLEDGLQEAQTARAALGQAMSNRDTLPTRFADDPVQTALLIASAETLGEFATQVALARPDQTETLTREGNLPLPVTGYVLPDDGSGRAGVRIAAAPRALVTAPAAATILFQGALLDYGTVVILEPAVNVLFVLAGLEEVFREIGEVLAKGAPIGLLGDDQTYDDGILTENDGIGTGARAQTLYLEVRDGQGTVNPDAWFALE